MSTPLRPEYFGPYRVIHQIGSAHNASRFVVLCDRTDTNYTLYRFDRNQSAQSKKLSFHTFMKMSSLDQAHILSVQSVTYDDFGRLNVVSPYTGNHDGIVTLRDVLSCRDGTLGVVESSRAIEHLLGASAYAHEQGVFNGEIEPDDLLIDRYGCMQIQFYGYKYNLQTLRSSARDQLAVLDEVRSIVEIGYTMLTGLKADGERIDPSKVIKKIDRQWDQWFELGLDPLNGFESAQHALNALPTQPGCQKYLQSKASPIPQVQIGSMLRRRFRTSSTTPRR